MEEIEVEITAPLKDCFIHCLDCDPGCCGVNAFYPTLEVVSGWMRRVDAVTVGEARRQLSELLTAVEDPTKGVTCLFLNAHSCNPQGRELFLQFLREFSNSLNTNLTGTYSIRFAIPKDIETIAHILHRAFDEFYLQYTKPAFIETRSNTNKISARFSTGPIWLATLDTFPAGTVWGTIENNSLHIRSMAVLPSARGYGIGQNLLQHAEEFALANNCNRLHLSTTPFLAQAIKLYRRFGFHDYDTGSPHGTPLILMEKLLPTQS